MQVPGESISPACYYPEIARRHARERCTMNMLDPHCVVGSTAVPSTGRRNFQQQHGANRLNHHSCLEKGHCFGCIDVAKLD
jgi:hypothetical protein